VLPQSGSTCMCQRIANLRPYPQTIYYLTFFALLARQFARGFITLFLGGRHGLWGASSPLNPPVRPDKSGPPSSEERMNGKVEMGSVVSKKNKLRPSR
jgi:hypothetical protein